MKGTEVQETVAKGPLVERTLVEISMNEKAVIKGLLAKQTVYRKLEIN